ERVRGSTVRDGGEGGGGAAQGNRVRHARAQPGSRARGLAYVPDGVRGLAGRGGAGVLRSGGRSTPGERPGVGDLGEPALALRVRVEEVQRAELVDAEGLGV